MLFKKQNVILKSKKRLNASKLVIENREQPSWWIYVNFEADLPFLFHAGCLHFKFQHLVRMFVRILIFREIFRGKFLILR